MFYVFLGCFAQEIPRTAGYEVINTIDNISSLSFLLLPSSCELHRVGIVVFPASAMVCGYQQGETALSTFPASRKGAYSWKLHDFWVPGGKTI